MIFYWVFNLCGYLSFSGDSICPRRRGSKEIQPKQPISEGDRKEDVVLQIVNDIRIQTPVEDLSDQMCQSLTFASELVSDIDISESPREDIQLDIHLDEYTITIPQEEEPLTESFQIDYSIDLEIGEHENDQISTNEEFLYGISANFNSNIIDVGSQVKESTVDTKEDIAIYDLPMIVSATLQNTKDLKAEPFVVDSVQNCMIHENDYDQSSSEAELDDPEESKITELSSINLSTDEPCGRLHDTAVRGNDNYVKRPHLEKLSSGSTLCSLSDNLVVDQEFVRKWKSHSTPINIFRGNMTSIIECVCYSIEHQYIPTQSRYDTEKLRTLISTIANSYNINVPYHNIYHAAQVTYAVWSYLEQYECKTLFTAEERISLLLAAFGQHIDHSGLSNAYIIQSKHELHRKYKKSQFPLQEHQAAKLIAMFYNSGFCASPTLRKKISTHLYNLMLSSSSEANKKIISQANILAQELRVSGESISKASKRHRQTVLLLLLCASESSGFRCQQLNGYWGALLQKELNTLAELHEKESLPATCFVKEESEKIQSHLKYIKDFALPPVMVASLLIPSISSQVIETSSIIKYWESLLNNEKVVKA